MQFSPWPIHGLLTNYFFFTFFILFDVKYFVQFKIILEKIGSKIRFKNLHCKMQGIFFTKILFIISYIFENWVSKWNI